MHHPRPIRLAACALFLATPILSTGCVFDKIEKQLVAINDNMEVTQGILLDANSTLHEVQQQLNEVQRTNDLLVQLQAGLGTEGLAATAAENRMSIIGTMEAISTSLGRMDEHMTALRKTISNIDSTIPFLKFSADAPGEPGTLEDGAAPAEGEPGAQGVAPPPDASAPVETTPPTAKPKAE